MNAGHPRRRANWHLRRDLGAEPRWERGRSASDSSRKTAEQLAWLAALITPTQWLTHLSRIRSIYGARR
jgi:hypothetical protein